MRTTLAAVCWLAIAPAFALSQNFEAATIKTLPEGAPGGGIGGGPGTRDPELFRCRGCSLGLLLRTAFHAETFQLSVAGGTGSERFEISAKIPPGATQQQFEAILQNFLVDRFKIQLHREQREMPMFEMTVAKSGAKLVESSQEEIPPPAARVTGVDKNGYPLVPLGCQGCRQEIDGKGRFHSAKTTMPKLAEILTHRLERFVIDKTGLNGVYDIDVTYFVGRADADGEPVADDVGSSFEKALQVQLGLKLDAKKAPVEMIVIDHLERTPIGN